MLLLFHENGFLAIHRHISAVFHPRGEEGWGWGRISRMCRSKAPAKPWLCVQGYCVVSHTKFVVTAAYHSQQSYRGNKGKGTAPSIGTPLILLHAKEFVLEGVQCSETIFWLIGT